MLILRYFLTVGPILSALIFAWSVSLTPDQPTAQVAKAKEVHRPTPAPPLEEQNAVAPVPATTEREPSNVQPQPVKAARVHPRKPKRTIARPRKTPDNSYAYAPAEPFFFGWR
jgi:hypothetical protein